jgi:hypothetical protein
MNDWFAIALGAYVLVGLIVAKLIMAGTPFEKTLESESGSVTEGRWAPSVIIFFVGVVFWPVAIAVAILAGRDKRDH